MLNIIQYYIGVITLILITWVWILFLFYWFLRLIEVITSSLFTLYKLIKMKNKFTYEEKIYVNNLIDKYM